MAVKLKWPWLGIAIPTFLISFIGYGAHYFILSNFLSISKQLLFELSLSMIWVSYYLAIYTNAGRPLPNYRPSPLIWPNFCKKCQSYKPERSHHCKACNQCVLMMDHHCPWTMNCVGFRNYPHFLRFLFWVIVTTSILFCMQVKRICFIWQQRSLPGYLFEKSELIFLTILSPLDFFVLLTIAILFLRCLSNQIINGRSQIESWDMDRLESLCDSGKLIPKLIDNTWRIYPEARSSQHERDADKLLTQRGRARFDELVSFPYNFNPCTNAILYLGPIRLWLWPYGTPAGDGNSFPKNDISQYEVNSPLEDIILSLPWPPDGNKTKAVSNHNNSTIETYNEGGEQIVRSRNAQHGSDAIREKWYNDWGESLDDFGVDVDME